LKEKEKLILDSAKKLFAKKGFSSTSIQEIVNDTGISKGAFYLYFKSKEELLHAIFDNSFEELHAEIFVFENRDLEPREKFISQLSSLFSTFATHKDFMIMLTREQSLPRHEGLKELIFARIIEIHQFYRKGLSSIYGEKITPYLWDLSMMLEGMFQPFFKILLHDPESFKADGVAEYIMRRMDSIVRDIIQEEPIISEEKNAALLEAAKEMLGGHNANINTILKNMKKEALSGGHKEDLAVSMEVLEAEIMSGSPRVPVIQGMLSNFKGIREFDGYISMIAEHFHISL
jgi:AcrR family transcriptional regulator